MSTHRIRAPFLTVVLSLFAFAASAQFSTSALRSFGLPNLAATHPQWRPIELNYSDQYGTYTLGVHGTTVDGGSYGQGTLYRINNDGTGFTVVHHFQGSPNDGATPAGELFQLSANIVGGVTSAGGAQGLGTFYVYDPFQKTFATRYHFTGGATGGANPVGALVGVLSGPGGPTFYGVTENGGPMGAGVIYRINYQGTGFTIIRAFTNGIDGGYPASGLTLVGSTLYGTTRSGGGDNNGVLYKIGTDGSGFSELVSFGGPNGAPPAGPVTLVGTNLYGMTTYGGIFDQGLVYRIPMAGGPYSVLHSFHTGGQGVEGLEGAFPRDRLIVAMGGLVGVTTFGGYTNLGTLFSIVVNTNAVIPVFPVANFPSLGGGSQPLSAISLTLSGLYFGVAPQDGLSGNGSLYAMVRIPLTTPPAYRYTNFWHFSATGGDALSPVTPLLLSTDGWLYGVAPAGGGLGGGAVYRTSKAGLSPTVIYHFGAVSNDVRQPAGGLLEATDGLFYGVARLGGVAEGGAIFQMTRTGSNWVVLKSFDQTYLDGAEPDSPLIEARDGLLYGTTRQGGLADQGVIFRLQKDGSNFAVLHHWMGGATDGASPNGVIEGADGWLYGTTAMGGSNDLGTVFRTKPDGTGLTLLRHGSQSEGAIPRAGLIEGSDGFLYGTMREGGGQYHGTVYKLNKDGSGFAVIRQFGGSVTDPVYPACRLVEGSDRALYGVSAEGGDPGYGAVFRVTRNGAVSSVVGNFNLAGLGGFGPVAGLVKDTDGSLYGVTEQGGDLGRGTVFKLTPTAANQPPVVSTSIGPRTVAWAAQTSFSFGSGTFSDADVGQTLSYTATGFPAGLSFTGVTRTFSGAATNLGSQMVTVVATDNGSPPYSAVEKFLVHVVTVPPRVTAKGPVGGAASLSLQATNGQTLIVQRSTNLIDWLPWTTNTVVTPPLLLNDPGAATRPSSFYRAVIKP